MSGPILQRFSWLKNVSVVCTHFCMSGGWELCYLHTYSSVLGRFKWPERLGGRWMCGSGERGAGSVRCQGCGQHGGKLPAPTRTGLTGLREFGKERHTA